MRMILAGRLVIAPPRRGFSPDPGLYGRFGSIPEYMECYRVVSTRDADSDFEISLEVVQPKRRLRDLVSGFLVEVEGLKQIGMDVMMSAPFWWAQKVACFFKTSPMPFLRWAGLTARAWRVAVLVRSVWAYSSIPRIAALEASSKFGPTRAAPTKVLSNQHP